MNSNTIGMVKINENTTYGEIKNPTGFIVREKYVEGTPVSLEYGTYLTNDVFLGIPIHFNLKDRLLQSNNMNTDEYHYYLVPAEMQFGISSYRSKKTNKPNPLLVEPSEKHPAMMISSLAFSDNDVTILNAHIDDMNSKVLRKYIDKDRKVIGLIMVNTDSGLVNPTTTVHLKYGKGNNYSVKTYKFGSMIPGGVEMRTEDFEVSGEVGTEFINLPMMYSDRKENNGDRKPRRNNKEDY